MSSNALFVPARLAVALAAVVAGGLFVSAAGATTSAHAALVRPANTRVWTIDYRSHTGRLRRAYVLLPSWYGPRRHPPIPLVISPHGRGIDGATNAKLWGDLPGLGPFAVVNPDGEGDHLDAYSWGSPGQIEDLAKMPAFLAAALPWLEVDERHIYAVGGSMGGQETLLLVAKHPDLLAGAAAFDSTVDFAHQYAQFPRLGCTARCRAQLGAPLGVVLQRRARLEVGGDPAHEPDAYAARSPLSYERAIAASCVPLELWWSSHDRIVVDPELQSGRLLADVRRLNPAAPIDGVEGTWAHSAEMTAGTRLPEALVRLGLLPPAFDDPASLAGVSMTSAPQGPCRRV